MRLWNSSGMYFLALFRLHYSSFFVNSQECGALSKCCNSSTCLLQPGSQCANGLCCNTSECSVSPQTVTDCTILLTVFLLVFTCRSSMSGKRDSVRLDGILLGR